jgi:Spy/CpxP family protein refolding chaperone
MNRRTTLRLLILLFLASAAYAQHHKPYAGQHERDLKALSPQEVQQYLAGAGMGYAKPAELNRFPGPMHVLELADRLELTADQWAATKKLMGEHKAEARAIGAKLVDAERAIETLFRSGEVPAEKLAQAVNEATVLEGQYRLSHLETHRRMRALLTDEQVKRYDELRGYGHKGGHKH